MSRMKVMGIVAAAAMAVPAVAMTGDWAGDLAKKAVGKAAREGIEHALKEEALDEALDVAGRGVVRYADSVRREDSEREDISEAVGSGVEAAMRAADVADALEDAADVAETLSKVNKIRKAIR